jgi:hypothetical protein
MITRFCITNPLASHWGESAWFVPYIRPSVGAVIGYWVSCSDHGIYHETELTPSLVRNAELVACSVTGRRIAPIAQHGSKPAVDAYASHVAAERCRMGMIDALGT